MLVHSSRILLDRIYLILLILKVFYEIVSFPFYANLVLLLLFYFGILVTVIMKLFRNLAYSCSKELCLNMEGDKN